MKEKILIVDDEADIRGMIEYVLSEEGYEVENASNGEEALAFLSSEPFDLVVTDIKMPLMDGLTLLRKIKALDELIEIIVLTGYASVQNAVEAMKEGGAFDFIEKPLEEIDLIITTASRALEKRRLTLQNRELDRQLQESHRKLENRYKKLKQTEKELRRAKEEAERSSRAKGRFITKMSHGFKTPLNAILGFSQFMEKDASLTPEQLENVDIIKRGGNDLLETAEKVLDNSRFETGRISLVKTIFDLHALLDEVRHEGSRQADAKGLQFVYSMVPGVPQFVRTDKRRLQKVLKSLVANSVAYTEKGMVTLTAGVVTPAPLRLFFEVRDTGPGVAPSEADTIFEPFMQGKYGADSGIGAGLDLAIGRHCAELMGGRLTLESEEGEGAAFRLEILSEAAVLKNIIRKKEKRKVTGLVPGQPEYRVLIVDDLPINRLIVREMLNLLKGFQIKEAIDGYEAVDLFEQWQPHLIWMDIKMPMMDGFETTRMIRTKPGGKEVKIVFLSASSFEDEREALIEAGGDDFMEKPFKMEDLYEMMGKQIGVRYTYKE